MPSLSLAYHFLFIFVFKISPLWVLISVTNVSQYKFPCRDDSVSCVVGKTELNWGLTEEQLNVAITTRIVVLFVIVRKKFENIYPNGNNSYLRRLLKRSWFSGVISLFQWASKFHKQIMPPRNPIWFDDAMLGETPHSTGSEKLLSFCKIKVLSTWIKISNQRNLWICSHSYILYTNLKSLKDYRCATT